MTKFTATSESSAEPQPESVTGKWHTFTCDDVCVHLDCGRDGLSSSEARDRLVRYGPNSLPTARPRSAAFRFAMQFHNLLIYVLMVAAGVTGLMGHWIDTSVILAVCILNAVIGFVQEGKAEETLRAISRMLSPQAAVLRDGHRQTIRRKIWCPEMSSCLSPATAYRLI